MYTKRIMKANFEELPIIIEIHSSKMQVHDETDGTPSCSFDELAILFCVFLICELNCSWNHPFQIFSVSRTLPVEDRPTKCHQPPESESESNNLIKFNNDYIKKGAYNLGLFFFWAEKVEWTLRKLIVWPKFNHRVGFRRNGQMIKRKWILIIKLIIRISAIQISEDNFLIWNWPTSLSLGRRGFFVVTILYHCTDQSCLTLSLPIYPTWPAYGEGFGRKEKKKSWTLPEIELVGLDGWNIMQDSLLFGSLTDSKVLVSPCLPFKLAGF